MNGAKFLILAMAVLVTAMRAEAAEVRGTARLIDGDTLVVGGQVVRLHGIDAPETGQTCRDGAGRLYNCGAAATDELGRLIGRKTLSCTGREFDRYERLIAVCRVGNLDISRAMVRAGWALAFRKYSEDYLDEELEAAKAGRGVWRGGFARPDEHRARTWAEASSARPDGCPIKGNISRSGRIYHVPWSRSYDKTRIDTSRGERWFCSEAEALAAGWRAPRR